jgi:hypothetical protein
LIEALYQHQFCGNGPSSTPKSGPKPKIDYSFLVRGIASLVNYPSNVYFTDVEKAKKTSITFYQFSNLIDWFGPLKGSAHSEPMIFNLSTALTSDWFFGPCEKIEADKLVKRFKNTNCFLIRLNTGQSIAIDKAPFVITKESAGESIHIRVYPDGGFGKWVCKLPSNEKVKGGSIDKLIESLKSKGGYNGNPVADCPFRALTVTEDHGAYAGDNEQGLDDL